MIVLFILVKCLSHCRLHRTIVSLCMPFMHRSVSISRSSSLSTSFCRARTLFAQRLQNISQSMEIFVYCKRVYNTHTHTHTRRQCEYSSLSFIDLKMYPELVQRKAKQCACRLCMAQGTNNHTTYRHTSRLDSVVNYRLLDFTSIPRIRCFSLEHFYCY